MAEETTFVNTDSNQEEQLGYDYYIDTINELKKNSVSRADYEKLREENKTLVSSLAAGKAFENDSTESAAKPGIEELRNKFLTKDMTNLEYWETALDLRDALIESGAKDPFLPYGQKITATAEDVQKAQQVADVVRSCIDYADGNPRLFTQELDRNTIDTAPAARKGKRGR